MNTQLLDLNRLNELQELLEEAFPEMLQEYIDDAQNRLVEAKTAIAESNIELLRRQLHTLKGASANMGAIAFSAQARELESSCHTLPLPDDFAGKLEVLTTSFPATIEALTQWQQNH